MTGAPGAGKSATLVELLGRRTDYLFFDVDWLADAGSRLSGRSIYEDASTWPAYRALWLDVLAGVARNGRQPVWFGPWNAADLAETNAADRWQVEWLLLDCADDVRRTRLRRRPGWTAAMEDEAVEDAAQLRAEITVRVDTGTRTVGEVADAVLGWLAGL